METPTQGHIDHIDHIPLFQIRPSQTANGSIRRIPLQIATPTPEPKPPTPAALTPRSTARGQHRGALGF